MRILGFYTVTIVFEDRTYAVEQYREADAEAALVHALRDAEAMSEYPRGAVEKVIAGHLNINQLADRKGVWNWHVIPNSVEECASVFGGIVVQTDPESGTR